MLILTIIILLHRIQSTKIDFFVNLKTCLIQLNKMLIFYRTICEQWTDINNTAEDVLLKNIDFSIYLKKLNRLILEHAF